jgi:hypothetical protein
MARSEHLLSHQELVKAVIIYQNIHDGFWRLNINFNVAATHGTLVPDPCVAVSIEGIGIMPADPADEMAVDASIANPEKIPSTSDVARNTSAGMVFCRDAYRHVAMHLDDASKPVSASTAIDLRPPRK